MKLVKNAMLHTCTDKTMTLLHIPTVPRLYSVVDYSSHVNQTLAMIIHDTIKTYFLFNCYNINFPLLLAFYL